MSRSNCSPCAALGLVMAALGLPLLAHSIPAVTEPVAIHHQEDPPHAEDPLHGMWMRYETRGEGDPLRFWYFHGDGKGLYRYGKVGLANTHSFDYDIEGTELYLRFRKSGKEHVMFVDLERDQQGRAWMSLRDDPYEPGARYRRVDSEIDFAAATREWAPAGGGEGLGDRLWIDYQTFASGGAEFHMYQLAKTAIDGRGVGWFHRGDFDNWSTESLTYRIDGQRLELFFDIREEPNVTTFRVVDGPHGRELVLDADPRDYWATHRYRDGGRSFGTSAFDAVLGIEAALADL
ncbi:MAG TPA: hypothetical protein VM869_18015 [Enhygromyxa sp.]|nr:hypothetical protein [Enhygromyxa sp.]